ncbi:hemerythrin domain-containing protein [Zavarzinia compransoris]|uniref:hemerythrin domain-containing protein n=1 Tax=Zavarzinia marina TaxID=2911065 RepID=UPI001F267C47|nr:hemerythrin domain-containing protein [Zavarzinia marina]MCF4167046.1 hemerythrin domain-containing protein [Zavarzinia marina]
MPIDTAPRYDIYGGIHKGLRLALAHLLLRIGSADFADLRATAELLADLRAQLALSRAHLAHEEAHIHPALESRAPGAGQRLEHQHRHHEVRFEELADLIARLEVAQPGARPAIGHALYLAFSLFVAEDFAHMHEEETVTGPLLQAHFTDADLQAIEFGIISSLTPEENIAYMRLMLPAMTPAERLALLAGMKAGAPAEAFSAVIELAARPMLAAHDFAALVRGLGLGLAA